MIKDILTQLPDSPGIYLYYNVKKELIYVGKATSLRQRVKSYFIGKRTPRPIEEMIHEVVDIQYKTTESVLEAIILESVYIKKYKPVYNVLGKDDKSWNYIVLTKDEYPLVQTIREHELKQLTTGEKRKEFAYVFGPFPGLNTKATMKLLRQLFHFCTCRPGNTSCLYYQMGQCFGVFKREISPVYYREKVIQPLILLLRGEKKRLITQLESEMKRAAKQEQFEEAARLRNQLQSLYRIHDIALINKSFFDLSIKKDSQLRIEGYDISNLGTTGKVGSMVVFQHGEPAKAMYRKFKIKTVEGQSDVDCLQEVLERRLKHTEWTYPALFLIDGGKPQVNRAVQVVKSFGLSIPVVGIAKGPERKRNDFILGSTKKEFIKFVHENQEILISVRDEAHRFAITYQRKVRDMTSGLHEKRTRPLNP